HITYNKAYGHDSQASFRVFSGGGIYVDASHRIASNDYRGKPGKLILHRVVITQNHSDYQGGGIAACPTGESNVNFNLGNGTAIYNNTAMPSVGSYDEIGIQSTDPNASNFVTDTVLGGGEYNWQEYESGVWTNYYNPLTDSSPAIITAKSLAPVWITNNHGYLGGGIGNNGIIEIGGQLDDTTISITITKEWVGENIPRPDYIAVQILQDGEPYGDLIKIYKTIDSNNQEIWPTCYVDGLPGGHTYTIEEVPIFGYSSEVTANENNFTITNTSVDFGVVKKWVGDEEANRPDSIEVQLLQNGTPYGEPVLLDATNNWSYFWTDLPETDEHDNPYEYSVQEIDAPDGYYISSSELVPESGMWEITNTKIETTTISAEKRWAEGTTPTNSITLQLKADGENYGDPVVLNAANNWFCRWEDLPKYTAEQAPNGTPIVYTITEISIPGYQTSIVQTDPSQASASWTEAAALEDGKTYLLVTANGALAGRSDYQLQWLNVSNELLTGGTPIQAALWTYSSTGSTLRNGDGKYLVLGDLSGSYVFFTNTTSRLININNGRLSATGGSSTRYFTGNFNQYNYGITSNNSSEAIIFTLYTLENDTENWGETHYIVTNETEPSYVLPETGGPGTTWYTVGGILLITSALLLLYLYKKRREDTLTSC
ncbi:MAG: Cna B-type domain-containing protein, partial [Clostridiales bacterium]|nr:Cna B-type domain-containing protein [Clostridiales bacterium]